MWAVADYAKDPGKEAGMSSPKHDLALRKPRNQHSIYRKHLERKPFAYILPVRMGVLVFLLQNTSKYY